MTRSQLVAALSKSWPDLVARDVDLAVDMILARIGEQLAGGGRVEIRGFGVWSTHVRRGRAGRNPATGKPVAVPPKAVIRFKPGRELANRVNMHGARHRYTLHDLMAKCDPKEPPPMVEGWDTMSAVGRELI